MTYETQRLSTTERRLAALTLAQSIYDYDTDTGVITRRRDGKVMDKVQQSGSVSLFTEIRNVTAQQFAWYLLTGLDPREGGAQIMHLDNDPTNNHWSNLERVRRVIKDRAPNHNNTTSPYSGVYLHKGTGKYRAHYRDANGKKKFVPGRFDTAHEAKAARDAVVGEMVQELLDSGFKTRIEWN